MQTTQQTANEAVVALPQILEERRGELIALCREFGVARLEVFGSVMTPEFDPERSDLDFLVSYPPDYDYGPWLGRYQDLEVRLAELFGRKVDLVMVSALKNRWFNLEAAKTRRVIFDSSEIAQVA